MIIQNINSIYHAVLTILAHKLSRKLALPQLSCHLPPPHQPGPLHCVREHIFLDASCPVPESCLPAQRVPGSRCRHRIVLRHVDQKTGAGKKAEKQELRNTGTKSKKTNGYKKATERNDGSL